MKNKLILATMIGSQFLFLACTQVYITEIKRPTAPVFAQLQSSDSKIETDPDVILLEFKKTYNGKYNSDTQFVNEYANNFQKKLFGSILIPDSANKHLIKISNFRIENKIKTSTSSAGPNMPMTTTSTEFCVISARFRILEADTKETIADFEAKGEGSVFLFAYEAALIQAMNNSIDHAISYMKSGKTEF